MICCYTSRCSRGGRDVGLAVHSAYLRLVDVKNTREWNGRRHFFAAAAEGLRWILAERARPQAAGTRGGLSERKAFDEAKKSVPGGNAR